MHGLGLPASTAPAEVDLTEELQAMQVRRLPHCLGWDVKPGAARAC